MSKNKELADYIMDQLSDLGDIRNIPMMGGYIFYYKERIFGGIYGKGFLVKITGNGGRDVSGVTGEKTKKEKSINCGKSLSLLWCKLEIMRSMNTLLTVMVSGVFFVL